MTLTTRVSQAAALLPVPLSVSVGSTVAAPYHRLTLWQLVNAADAGLTRAKRARRMDLGLEFNPDDIPTIRSGRTLRSVPRSVLPTAPSTAPPLRAGEDAAAAG